MHHFGRKITSVFLAFVAVIGMIFYPHNTFTSSAAEDYRSWRQYDSRWGSMLDIPEKQLQGQAVLLRQWQYLQFIPVQKVLMISTPVHL
jgi:ATP/ADP translocase